MFKVNNKDNRTAAMTRVFAVNFEHISHIVLVFPLLSLNKWMPIELRLKNHNISSIYAKNIPCLRKRAFKRK